MNKYKIEVNNISKSFNNKNIFKNVCFSSKIGNSIALIGNNGSGKSTMLNILINYLPKTSGEIKYFENNNLIISDFLCNYYFLIAPYYNLYEEFSAIENIKIALNLKNITFSDSEINSSILKFGLENQLKKDVCFYSSGMKQRLKFVIADLIKPPFIFIDEPTSNLDENGKKIICSFLDEIQKTSVLIFATNEKDEIKYANQIINLNEL